MAHYIIFGDSISWGEADPAGGWFQYLRQNLSGNTFYNLSVDGETTEALLNHFEAELKLRLFESGLLYFLIALGVNDSAWLINEKHSWVPVEKYRANLIQLIKTAKKYTQNIVLVGPAPVDQTKVDPAPWAPHLSYKTDAVKLYSGTMESVAEAEKLKFVDLFNQLPAEYLKTLDDGVHPNREGHQMT